MSLGHTRPAPTGFWYDNLRILTIMGVIGGLLIGTLLALTVGPHTPRLGRDSTGDQALINDVRAVLASERGLKTLSVGRVRGGQVSFAGLGAEDGAVPTPQTPYELGSITKTFTGMLLADAVQRGEMAFEDPLASHLPELGGTPAGEVSLYELATHSSGLPPLAPTGSGVLLAVLSNDNPYDISVEELLEASKSVQLENPGRYAYSNLGMSLLGHAEARAAGVADWATLVRQRLLTPLGMAATTFAMSEDDIPAGGVRGHRENGWRAAYWYGAAYVPAGSSTWSTAEDMMTFAQAVLAGRAPGMAALEPEGEATTGEIGLAWHTSEVERREITWHNGGTGGMHTILALDRERGQAVIVLSNTSRSIDLAGLHLAAATGTPPAADRLGLPSIPVLAGTIAAIAFLVGFVRAALRGQDKLAVVNGLLSGIVGLLILLAYGPWTWVPAWIWGALTGASAALAGYAVLRARTLPTWPARRPALGWVSAGANLIVLVLVVVAL